MWMLITGWNRNRVKFPLCCMMVSTINVLNSIYRFQVLILMVAIIRWCGKRWSCLLHCFLNSNYFNPLNIFPILSKGSLSQILHLVLLILQPLLLLHPLAQGGNIIVNANDQSHFLHKKREKFVKFLDMHQEIKSLTVEKSPGVLCQSQIM